MTKSRSGMNKTTENDSRLFYLTSHSSFSCSDPLALDEFNDEDEDEDSDESDEIQVLTNGNHDDGDGEEEVDPLAITPPESVITGGSTNGKKKRKSSAEKFLEDNSDYYQIKVSGNSIFI